MPIDLSFEHTASFRDISQAGLVLLRRPVVRSLEKLRSLRRGESATDPLPPISKSSQPLRRSPLTGSLS